MIPQMHHIIIDLININPCIKQLRKTNANSLIVIIWLALRQIIQRGSPTLVPIAHLIRSWLIQIDYSLSG